MGDRITILDDEPDRIAVMVPLIRQRFPDRRLITFDNAPDMIEWLKSYLSDCVLICLDHDLGPNRARGENVFDPGTGRDVADFMATCPPICPVVIHTTNSMAAPGMEMVLCDAGWPCSRVIPYEDTRWISESWIGAIHTALRG